MPCRMKGLWQQIGILSRKYVFQVFAGTFDKDNLINFENADFREEPESNNTLLN